MYSLVQNIWRPRLSTGDIIKKTTTTNNNHHKMKELKAHTLKQNMKKVLFLQVD